MTSKSTTTTAAINAGINLMRLAGERQELEAQIREQVHYVLELGGSWTTVSVALGVTRQAAHSRYR